MLVFVGIGGNVGDAQECVLQAARRLEALASFQDFRSSSLYATSPVGEGLQDNFVNAVVSFSTSLTPFDLLRQLNRIEEEMGRKREGKVSDRIIDLDLLFFGNKTICQPDLEVPHPRWKERLFVLKPLLELVPFIEVEGFFFELEVMIQTFHNRHNERVEKIYEKCCY